ncbi:DUF3404 domain-containing protein, partial [Vibrio rotiferianus]
GLIHPGGGSYAARYVDKYPELQDKLAQYMHIKERKNVQGDELLASLKSMNDDAINALIAGASMFIEQNELWLRRGDHYFVFPKSVWQENVANAGLSFKLASQTKSCFVKRGNICWDVEDHSQVLRISMIILVIANIFLVIGWAVYRWNSKRQELRSRMLVLQILTHELRTPIASLSLTVEGFRREFE